MDARSRGIFSERWNLMKRFEKPILATRPYSPPIGFYAMGSPHHSQLMRRASDNRLLKELDSIRSVLHILQHVS